MSFEEVADLTRVQFYDELQYVTLNPDTFLVAKEGEITLRVSRIRSAYFKVEYEKRFRVSGQKQDTIVSAIYYYHPAQLTRTGPRPIQDTD